jgi:CDP-diacylglycerol---serine O-phosphatidyltransferase
MSRRALLADGLSLANGSCGVVGVLLLLAWDDPRALTAACALVFVAWGFDAVDGIVARDLQRPPAEGAILDSLCDTTSFGVLPAVLLTAWWIDLNQPPALTGAVAGILFFCCVVLRLRRYTVRAVSDVPSRRTSFEGLPSPVAAMAVAASILAAAARPAVLAWLPFLFAVVCAPLMVSRMPYKDLPRLVAWLTRARWPIPVLVLIAFTAGSAIAATVFFTAYLASGALVRLRTTS